VRGERHTGSGHIMLVGASRTRHTVVGRVLCGFESRRPAHRRYTGPLEAAASVCVGGSMVGRLAVNQMACTGRRGFDSLPAHRVFVLAGGVEPRGCFLLDGGCYPRLLG
jgi:hypothetical protein